MEDDKKLIFWLRVASFVAAAFLGVAFVLAMRLDEISAAIKVGNIYGVGDDLAASNAFGCAANDDAVALKQRKVGKFILVERGDSADVIFTKIGDKTDDFVAAETECFFDDGRAVNFGSSCLHVLGKEGQECAQESAEDNKEYVKHNALENSVTDGQDNTKGRVK